MQIINLKQIIGLVALLGTAVFGLAFNPAVQTNEGFQAPELPAACENLQVPAGNKVIFRTYAVGVQVYRWSGSAWNFVEPVANLYADAGYRGKVGTHYVGPAWESNSGSIVVGAAPVRCTPDANAIPWLRLEATPTDDPGIFKNVTFIQRTNTTGGLAPTVAGTTIGEEKRVPYAAEYYFYRAEN